MDALGHPEVGGRRQLETAADHGALERRDDRDRPELDLLERAVPHARVAYAGERVALGHLGEVEAGAEVVAVGVDDDARTDDSSPVKKRSIPSTVSSLRALRFSGRARVRTATGPADSDRRVAGNSDGDTC